MGCLLTKNVKNVDINCLAYRRQNYDVNITSVRNCLFRYIKQAFMFKLACRGLKYVTTDSIYLKGYFNDVERNE